MVVNAGAKSRWANFLVGVLIATTILLFAGLVELIAMPALAGLLIVIGFRTLDFPSIRTVWQTGAVPVFTCAEKGVWNRFYHRQC